MRRAPSGRSRRISSVIWRSANNYRWSRPPAPPARHLPTLPIPAEAIATARPQNFGPDAKPARSRKGFKPEGGKKILKEKLTGRIFGAEDEDTGTEEVEIDNSDRVSMTAKKNNSGWGQGVRPPVPSP